MQEAKAAHRCRSRGPAPSRASISSENPASVGVSQQRCSRMLLTGRWRWEEEEEEEEDQRTGGGGGGLLTGPGVFLCDMMLGVTLGARFSRVST